jgi:hypothetical protein
MQALHLEIGRELHVRPLNQTAAAFILCPVWLVHFVNFGVRSPDTALPLLAIALL